MPSRDINDLSAQFRPAAAMWLEDCRRAGLDILVTCTLRSHEEQAELYKIGRTKKGADVTASRPMGRRVTNAKPGQSAHQYGLALDFVPMVGGKPMWNDAKRFDTAIRLAEAHGMHSLRPMETAHLEVAGFDWREYMK